MGYLFHYPNITQYTILVSNFLSHFHNITPSCVEFRVIGIGWLSILGLRGLDVGFGLLGLRV